MAALKQSFVSLKSEQLASAARSRAERFEIEVSSTVTRYWRYRATKANAAKLVFIHGYRGNHHGLEAIAGALEEFEIYIPDLPGFGESTEFAEVHSVERYADWLTDFIRVLKLKDVHLLGHSFGSIVAACHAAKSSDISTLILVNPVAAPALHGPRAMLTRLARSFFWLSGRLPLGVGLWLLKSWPMVRGMSIVMTKSRNTQLRKWVHQQHDSNFNDFASRRVAIEGYQASISHSVGEYAPNFRVATGLIIGQKDDITTPSQQRSMATTIPTVHSVYEIHEVGHLTHYESPWLVADFIRQHLLEAGQHA